MKKQAQIAGLGVGFLPYNLIKDEVKQRLLIIKKVEKEKPESLFYLGWNSKKSGKAQQWLLDQIRTKGFRQVIAK